MKFLQIVSCLTTTHTNRLKQTFSAVNIFLNPSATLDVSLSVVYLQVIQNGLEPASLPGMADIRMARRIEGAYELSDRDANMHFDDNIAGTGDWRRPGPVYEIPYRTLFNDHLENVLCAGRCISVSGEAWEIIRCIPQASATGQAAGTAASQLIEEGTTVRNLDVSKLRSTLKADGVILDVNKDG